MFGFDVLFVARDLQLEIIQAHPSSWGNFSYAFIFSVVALPSPPEFRRIDRQDT